jgi:hypothetical protein
MAIGSIRIDICNMDLIRSFTRLGHFLLANAVESRSRFRSQRETEGVVDL